VSTFRKFICLCIASSIAHCATTHAAYAQDSEQEVYSDGNSSTDEEDDSYSLDDSADSKKAQTPDGAAKCSVNYNAESANTPQSTNKSMPRRLNFITENGCFQNMFNTLEELQEASRGNSYNQLIKTTTPLIWLNSRCDKSAPISYSMSRPGLAGIGEPVDKYLEFWRADHSNDKNIDGELEKRERALIDEVTAKLKQTYFPRKAPCDAIPIMIKTGNYDAILLEIDDAQNPLVGTKLNDGMMLAKLTEKNPFVDRVRASENDPLFLEKYGYNSFRDESIAVNAAILQPTSAYGANLVIYTGTEIVLYKIGNFRINYDLKDAAFDAQFDVFKKAKMPSGWTILHVVIGQEKVININRPAGQ
jgi:hypothetical protein